MSQSLAQILLHITFSTKYQRPTIYPEIEQELFAYIVSICNDCGCYVHQINCTKDHIHIACNLSRTTAVSKLIEEAKKTSSRWIKTKDQKYEQFYWQKGYGAFSVGMSQLEIVKNYIANQKEHHQYKTFKDEYLEFLFATGHFFKIGKYATPTELKGLWSALFL